MKVASHGKGWRVFETTKGYYAKCDHGRETYHFADLDEAKKWAKDAAKHSAERLQSKKKRGAQ